MNRNILFCCGRRLYIRVRHHPSLTSATMNKYALLILSYLFINTFTFALASAWPSIFTYNPLANLFYPNDITVNPGLSIVGTNMSFKELNTQILSYLKQSRMPRTGFHWRYNREILIKVSIFKE